MNAASRPRGLRWSLPVVLLSLALGLGACGGPSPTAPAVTSFSTQGSAAGSVTFRWTVADPDGDALSCRLDADGDGSPEATIADCRATSQRTVTLPQPGRYAATLTVDDGSDTDSAAAAVIANGDGATPATWVDEFGTTQADYGFATGVAGDGTAYVAGLTPGTLGASSAGNDDAFVRRYGSDGTVGWTAQLGSSANDRATGVAPTADGGAVVSGWTQGAMSGSLAGGSDAFVARYDAGGHQVWLEQFGTSGADYALNLAVASDGTVVVVGDTDGVFPGATGNGGQDVFVAKFDASGQQLWVRQFGTSGDEAANDVAIDASGTAYLVGQTDGTLTGPATKGSNDAFVAAYGAQGGRRWLDQVGGSAIDQAWGVATGGGVIAVTGYTFGTLPGQTSAGGATDAFVLRYDTQGNRTWTHQFGSSGADYGCEVAVDAVGNATVLGDTDGGLDGHSNLGYDDVFLAKFAPDGSRVWTRQTGTSRDENARSIGVDASGNLILSGETGGAFPGTTNASTAYDVFLLKTLP